MTEYLCRVKKSNDIVQLSSLPLRCSHLNELRREVSGMGQIDSEYYEISRETKIVCL
jgi:hypothetical protein